MPAAGCYTPRMTVRALAGLLLLLAAACATGGPSTPPRTGARQWLEANRRDDPRAAHALLTDAGKQAQPYDTFARRWRETRAERHAQARALEAAIGEATPTPERALMRLPDGKQVELLREKDGWRLETPLVSPMRATTPQEALRQLAAAIEARDLDAAMRALTASRRDGLRVTLDSFLGGLRTHLHDEIVVTGDRAFLSWTDGKVRWKVTLLRENGNWRIDDVDRQ